MNKRFVLMALLLTVGSLFATATTAERNIAYSDAEVRFTVITPGTVRLEYAPDGKFVDNKSLMAINREYEKTDYKVKVGSWVEITTPVLRLRYKKGSGAFTDKNLVITSSNKQKGAFQFTWKPGMKQQANLKGTFRTLDNLDGDVRAGDTHEGKKGTKMELEDGLIARDGWTLIDDSQSLLFDEMAVG